MNEEARYILLTIIQNNGNIDDLIDYGYEYFQVLNYLKTEISNGFAEFKESILILTEKGIQERKELAKKFEYNKSEGFVTQLLSSVIKEKDNNEIFIPSIDELYF